MLKKKLLAALLASAMMTGMLSGCGSSGGDTGAADNSTADSSAADAAASDDAYNISVIVKLTDSHFNLVMAGAQAYADEHDNVNVEFLSPPGATAFDEQMNMIETSMGNDKFDAVIIAPLQSSTASTLVAGTDKVVVALDTDFDAPEKATFVGTGNKAAAKSGGIAAVEEAKKRGATEITAAILAGVQGDETHDARMEGYKEGIEEAGGTVIDVQYCDGMSDRASVAMEALMQKYPDGLSIVCSTNDDMVMSAAKMVQDYNLDSYKDTVLVGFDGNQSAIEAVQDGTLGMDVVQQAYDMGYKAVEAAVKVLGGETVEPYIDSGSAVVDASTVEEFIASRKELGLWEE